MTKTAKSKTPGKKYTYSHTVLLKTAHCGNVRITFKSNETGDFAKLRRTAIGMFKGQLDTSEAVISTALNR